MCVLCVYVHGYMHACVSSCAEASAVKYLICTNSKLIDLEIMHQIND